MSFGRQQPSYTFPSVDHATLSERAQDYCNGKIEQLWSPSLSLLVENSEEHPGGGTLESAMPLSLPSSTFLAILPSLRTSRLCNYSSADHGYFPEVTPHSR